MTIREALEAVVKESNQPYAVTYAQAALELGGSVDTAIVTSGPAIEILHGKTGKIMVGEELAVQILYVLANLAYWRGPRAKEVKAALKAVAK